MGVVQFKVHSSFRTEGRPRKSHMPISKLALVDTCVDSSGKSME